MKDRDFVHKRKIWNNFPNNNSCLLYFKSIQHNECAEYSNFIRAETIINAYFIETISTNPLKTIIYAVMQTDLKGSIPSGKGNNEKRWIDNLIQGIEYVKHKK